MGKRSKLTLMINQSIKTFIYRRARYLNNKSECMTERGGRGISFCTKLIAMKIWHSEPEGVREREFCAQLNCQLSPLQNVFQLYFAL